jgi:hypothetical protein
LELRKSEERYPNRTKLTNTDELHKGGREKVDCNGSVDVSPVT